MSTLREDYENALDALRSAQRAFLAIEFNQRDYYPSGDPATWAGAVELREAQVKALDSVHSYLAEHLEHID